MLLKRAAIAFRRHPFRIFAESGVAFGALWTLLEALSTMGDLPIRGLWKVVCLVLASAVIGIYRALPATQVSKVIPGTNTTLTITYADLFAESDLIVVPVNEYFDCLIGEHVSEKTVHGQTITRLYRGDSKAFERDVEKGLQNAVGTQVERTSGRQTKYPIGTTAYLPRGGPSVLAFALATTDVRTLKASADATQMWNALLGLWQSARQYCNGLALSVPLVGGGSSGVGLPPQQLLALIALSAAAETRREKVCSHIKICLMESVRDHTDIESIFLLLHNRYEL